jgi:serine/threonine-protein kinase RsbW
MATGTSRAGTPPLPSALVAGQRWRRVFPGEERQLSALRRWLSSLLPECEAHDNVIAVASELGSNAVKHTLSGQGGWFAVEITWYVSAVRVAVADCGGQSKPQVIDDPLAEHGRGLLLVRGLSLRTGTAGDHRGRLIWADIAWDDGGGVAPDPYEAAIRDDRADLARRFAGVPSWFGRSTLQWWALPRRGGLVTAPTARELAALLHRLQCARLLPIPDAAHR